MQCGAIRKNCLKHHPLPILQLIIPHVRSTALPFNTAFISSLLQPVTPNAISTPETQLPPPFPSALLQSLLLWSKPCWAAGARCRTTRELSTFCSLALAEWRCQTPQPWEAVTLPHILLSFVISERLHMYTGRRRGAASLRNRTQLPLRWNTAG